jgi:nucleoside-diphosphate-sugar epimerase
MANRINEFIANQTGTIYTERRNLDIKTRRLSSIEKAENILDYKPQTSFKKGVENLHHWFEENWENIDKSAEFLNI